MSIDAEILIDKGMPVGINLPIGINSCRSLREILSHVNFAIFSGNSSFVDPKCLWLQCLEHCLLFLFNPCLFILK